MRAGTGPKRRQASRTAGTPVSPTLQESPGKQQQQQGGGGSSKGRGREQLLALPELGLLAGGEEAGKAATHIYLVPHRTALGRVPEGPLMVDGVRLQRADDPARRRLRTGDKLVMHVCCGMGGASLHGRVNVQEERRKAVVERRKLQERRRARRGGIGDKGGEGGVSGSAGSGGQGAGPGGSWGRADPSGCGTGVATTDGGKAASAASGGSQGAGGSSWRGSGGARERGEQRGTAGRGEAGEAPDERPCKRRGEAGGGQVGAAAPRPGAGAAAAGPAQIVAGSALPARPGAPRTGGAGSGGFGGGGGGSGGDSDIEGNAGPSSSVNYSGLVTAGRKCSRADAGGGAAAAAAGDVPLESVMRKVATDDDGCIRLVGGLEVPYCIAGWRIFFPCPSCPASNAGPHAAPGWDIPRPMAGPQARPMAHRMQGLAPKASNPLLHKPYCVAFLALLPHGR